MTETSDLVTRTYYAKQIVAADKELMRAHDARVAMAEIDPVLAEDFDLAERAAQAVLSAAVSLLRSTGALDDVETEDGAVIRAWQYLDMTITAHPLDGSACQQCGATSRPLVDGLCARCRASDWDPAVEE